MARKKSKKMPQDDKHRRTNTKITARDITREEFHSLVKKAAQPVKETSESDSTSDET